MKSSLARNESDTGTLSTVGTQHTASQIFLLATSCMQTAFQSHCSAVSLFCFDSYLKSGCSQELSFITSKVKKNKWKGKGESKLSGTATQWVALCGSQSHEGNPFLLLWRTSQDITTSGRWHADWLAAELLELLQWAQLKVHVWQFVWEKITGTYLGLICSASELLITSSGCVMKYIMNVNESGN